MYQFTTPDMILAHHGRNMRFNGIPFQRICAHIVVNSLEYRSISYWSVQKSLSGCKTVYVVEEWTGLGLFIWAGSVLAISGIYLHKICSPGMCSVVCVGV